MKNKDKEFKTKNPTFNEEYKNKVRKVLEYAKTTIKEVDKLKEKYYKEINLMANSSTELRMLYNRLSSSVKAYKDIRFDLIKVEYFPYEGSSEERIGWSNKLELVLDAQETETLYNEDSNVVYRVVVFKGEDNINNVPFYNE